MFLKRISHNRQLVEGGQYLVEVEVKVEAQANKNLTHKKPETTEKKPVFGKN